MDELMYIKPPAYNPFRFEHYKDIEHELKYHIQVLLDTLNAVGISNSLDIDLSLYGPDIIYVTNYYFDHQPLLFDIDMVGVSPQGLCTAIIGGNLDDHPSVYYSSKIIKNELDNDGIVIVRHIRTRLESDGAHIIYTYDSQPCLCIRSMETYLKIISFLLINLKDNFAAIYKLLSSFLSFPISELDFTKCKKDLGIEVECEVKFTATRFESIKINQIAQDLLNKYNEINTKNDDEISNLKTMNQLITKSLKEHDSNYATFVCKSLIFGKKNKNNSIILLTDSAKLQYDYYSIACHEIQKIMDTGNYERAVEEMKKVITKDKPWMTYDIIEDLSNQLYLKCKDLWDESFYNTTISVDDIPKFQISSVTLDDFHSLPTFNFNISKIKPRNKVGVIIKLQPDYIKKRNKKHSKLLVEDRITGKRRRLTNKEAQMLQHFKYYTCKKVMTLHGRQVITTYEPESIPARYNELNELLSKIGFYAGTVLEIHGKKEYLITNGVTQIELFKKDYKRPVLKVTFNIGGSLYFVIVKVLPQDNDTKNYYYAFIQSLTKLAGELIKYSTEYLSLQKAIAAKSPNYINDALNTMMIIKTVK